MARAVDEHRWKQRVLLLIGTVVAETSPVVATRLIADSSSPATDRSAQPVVADSHRCCGNNTCCCRGLIADSFSVPATGRSTQVVAAWWTMLLLPMGAVVAETTLAVAEAAMLLPSCSSLAVAVVAAQIVPLLRRCYSRRVVAEKLVGRRHRNLLHSGRNQIATGSVAAAAVAVIVVVVAAVL